MVWRTLISQTIPWVQFGMCKSQPNYTQSVGWLGFDVPNHTLGTFWLRFTHISSVLFGVRKWVCMLHRFSSYINQCVSYIILWYRYLRKTQPCMEITNTTDSLCLHTNHTHEFFMVSSLFYSLSLQKSTSYG